MPIENIISEKDDKFADDIRTIVHNEGIFSPRSVNNSLVSAE